MTWQKTFDQVAAHYAQLAMTPGWWAYAQQQVIAMEQEKHGCWIGLRAEVGKRIKAAGFKPAASELVNWWDVPCRSLPPRQQRGG